MFVSGQDWFCYIYNVNRRLHLLRLSSVGYEFCRTSGFVWLLATTMYLEEFWKYQRCTQNSEIEEGQTTQRPKEKRQKDKQRSTKHYSKNYRSSNANLTKYRRWTQFLL